MTVVPDRVRLPLRFDADALAADAARLRPSDWLPHFNTAYYVGDWSGAPLRAVGGRAGDIYPAPVPTEPYADTELLDRCPAVRAALAMLHCELTSVRFLRLGPGARVREHRDHDLGYAYGEVRLHVPVDTPDTAEFVLDGDPVPMNAGECWYVDVTRPHRVANEGSTERVHLVADCRVNDWLTAHLVG